MRTVATLVGLISVLLLAGCGEPNYGGESKLSAAEAQKSLEDQIKKIEDNPNMPPQAKAAAIANLKNRQQYAPVAGKGM